MPLHGEALEAGYGTATAGAIAGGVGGFTSGLIASGGDLDAALIGGGTGAAFGFIGGSRFFGPVGRTGVPRVIAHGVVGGTSAELQGGEFVPGFFSAAVAKAATGPIDTELGGNIAAGTVATAVVGGTVSRISGGKFANGAVTASFGYLFNNQLSQAREEYIRDNAAMGYPYPFVGPAGFIGRVFRVVRAFFGIQPTTLTVDELVSGSTFLKESSRTLQLGRSGGFNEANRVFDTIVRTGNIATRETPIGVVRDIQLPGGGSASVRPISSQPDPFPTIQINRPGQQTIKIRFTD